MNLKSTDRLLKAMLVISRTVDHVLETRAIEASEQSLSKSRLHVLRLLNLRGAQNPTQIANYLGVSKPAVTQIVESLIKSEMVTRDHSGSDRRGVTLKLTLAGRQAFQRIQAHQRHMIRNAVREDPDQHEVWFEVVQSISKALAQADRTYKKFCFQCGAHADGTCVLVGGNADCPFLMQGRLQG